QRVERNHAGATLEAGAGLVEADVTRLADAQDLEVDAAGVTDLLFVLRRLPLDLVTRHVATREVDVLRRDVHAVEQVLLHVAPEAVDAVRLHGIVLVQVERHDLREVEPLFLMPANEFAIDLDRRAARREAEDRRVAAGILLPDQVRDAVRNDAREIAVLLDDHDGHLLAYCGRRGAAL